MEHLQIVMLKKVLDIQNSNSKSREETGKWCLEKGIIGFAISLVLCALSWYFLVGVAVCIIVASWGGFTLYELDKNKLYPRNAITALERNLPKLFKESAGGAEKYVRDIAYDLLSKWIKEDHCSANHAHLQSNITDLRINLSLLVMHFPEIIALNVDNFPVGEFKFDNVRNQGPTALEWRLLDNGILMLKLIHYDKDTLIIT